MLGCTTDNATPLKTPSNPQFLTPNSDKKPAAFLAYDQAHFQQARLLLHQGKVSQALDFFPVSSFVRELIIDHLEIDRAQQILMAQGSAVNYEDLRDDEKLFDVERQARLKALRRLKRSKCLNTTLVSNVSNHLQDILLEQFEPLSSFSLTRSHIFIKLYQKLNQIQQKFDLFKSNSSEIPIFIRQKAQQVAAKNKSLQQQLALAQQNIVKYQQEAAQTIDENNRLRQILKVLRHSQHRHERQRLDLQKDFNQKLQDKQEQYRQQLLEIKSKSNVSRRMKMMEKELDASIEDFKNLIYKLSLENKLLKEERDLLLAQLTRIYERFHVFIAFYETNQAPNDKWVPPLSLEAQKHHHQQQSTLINELRGKLTNLQLQIKDKNSMIQKIKEELIELRKDKQLAVGSQLNGSIEISSSESKDEKRLKKRYVRTKSGEQAASKIIELEQLRRMDSQLIESLSAAVQELTQKMRTAHSISEDSLKKKPQPQETINTISSSIECEELKPDEAIDSFYSKSKAQQQEEMERALERMKEKITTLEASLQQQRQTNASLNAILQDLQSFDKPKEDSSVLTPRMLSQIAELKESLVALTEKSGSLNKELQRVTQQKAELVRIYDEQVINLEFQCSQAQLEISTLENKIYDLEQSLAQQRQQFSTQLSSIRDTHSNIKAPEEWPNQKQQQFQRCIMAKDEEIQALLAEESLLKQQIEEISSRLKSSQKMATFLTTKNKEAQKKYKAIVTAKQFREQYPKQIQHALFYADILEDKPFEKYFLVQALQKRSGKAIKRSRLLWRYDPLNKTNFHQYIDNHENLVMLVELEDGYVVGAYSQGRIYPKMVSDRDGLLFSLTKKEVFEPVEANKRAVLYDEYYVIFGNSELRIKSQENKLYSNFGISSGYYKSKGLKVDMMTNSAQKEVSFINVEIHQIEYL